MNWKCKIGFHNWERNNLDNTQRCWRCGKKMEREEE